MATILQPLSNIDRESALLIAQLALGDIDELRGHTAISDQEYALQLMAEDFGQVLSFFNDTPLAEQDPGDGSPSRSIAGDSVTSSSSLLSFYDPQTVDLSLSIGTTNDAASSSSLPSSDVIQSDDESLESQFVLSSNNPASELEYPHQVSSIEQLHDELVSTCVACTGSSDEEPVFRVQTCGHDYCGSCLTHYVETCINDESLFPPKCCGRTMSFDVENGSVSTPIQNLILSLETFEIDPNLGDRLAAKALEFGVRPEDRVYCPYPRCSEFIGSWGSLKHSYGVRDTLPSESSSNPVPPPSHQCPACSEHLCVLCKSPAHDHSETTLASCPVIEERLAEDKLRDLARENKWQTCPGCKAIIEITEGCNHMVCRCRSEFCYTCGSVWTSICVCRG